MVDYIAMDIKTSLPNHKGLVGQWVVEKNIIDSIALLKQGSIPYEFRTTLIKEVHPSEVLDAMVEMIKGATHWYLQPFRPEVTLDPAFMNMYPFDEAETKAVADRYRPLVQNIIIR
jgi:pyruvate formate lyase activating enzyme